MVTLNLHKGQVQVPPLQDILQQVTCTTPFFALPNSGTLRYCSFTLSFCRYPFRHSVFYAPASCLIYSRLTIVRPFLKKKPPLLWDLLTSHSKLYFLFRSNPIQVLETSPGKDANLHPILPLHYHQGFG